MHQILGLRPTYDERKQKWDKTDATFFPRRWGFASLSDLFKNIDSIVDKIPPGERWNMYYTVAFCGEKKREFREQNIIVFDIDGIDVLRQGEYVAPITSCLGVDPQKTGLVFSGHGLHFIVLLLAPFADPEYFDNTRVYYNALCSKINAKLLELTLPGKTDTAVWDARRIMRLPNTLNRKDGRPEVMARVLHGEISEQDFDLKRAAGVPEVEASEQLDKSFKYPTPDTQSVLSGCEFLKWCKEKPDEISEVQWYGMLSIVPRLPPDGRGLAHRYSEAHSEYSYGETEAKIDQALTASGPRTCTNINGLWGRCSSCPNFDKVTSPIMIQGPNYIRTKDTGFHTTSVDKNGNPKPGKPVYEDLRRFFEIQNPYVILGDSRICFTWNGKFWDEYSDSGLEAFAQEHFLPVADNKMVSEFRGIVARKNIKPPEWFTDTTNKKINFANGILDLSTLELQPHNQNVGFRYCLDYDYNPEARAPQFEKFLHEIMDGREDLSNILLEFAGYAFSNDDCWAAKALLLSGEGANGKSTLLTLLQALAGQANYSAITLTDMKNEVHRKMLDGKLFNIAEETPTNHMIDSSFFKNLITGGDITVKQLYKQSYSIRTRAKLMFACNELPSTTDTTSGFARRLLIVPFDRKFEGEDRDTKILDKLKAELPGIFNLVIRGYQRLTEQKFFTGSVHVDEQLHKYREENDTVRAWFQACVTLEKVDVSTIETPLSALYTSYRLYAESCGEKPETQATVSKRLPRLIPDYDARWVRPMDKGRREIKFKAIKHIDGGGGGY